MIGQCKFCKHEVCEFHLINSDDFGCVKFEPQETLLESEISEWMRFVKFQGAQTGYNIIKNKRKFIRNGNNCIEIEIENGDTHIIPIDDDYLDYARDLLEEFIGDADFNDLAIGDKITFTFIRMSNENIEELCNNDA